MYNQRQQFRQESKRRFNAFRGLPCLSFISYSTSNLIYSAIQYERGRMTEKWLWRRSNCCCMICASSRRICKHDRGYDVHDEGDETASHVVWKSTREGVLLPLSCILYHACIFFYLTQKPTKGLMICHAGCLSWWRHIHSKVAHLLW